MGVKFTRTSKHSEKVAALKRRNTTVNAVTNQRISPTTPETTNDDCTLMIKTAALKRHSATDDPNKDPN